MASWEGQRAGLFGSLLLGVSTDQSLRFIGHVGTGFTDHALRELWQRLNTLHRPTSPFLHSDPDRGTRPRGGWSRCSWGEVEFRRWIVHPVIGERRLRHPN